MTKNLRPEYRPMVATQTLSEMLQHTVYNAIWFAGGLRQFGIRNPEIHRQIAGQALDTLRFFADEQHNTAFRRVPNTQAINAAYTAITQHARLALAEREHQPDDFRFVQNSIVPALQLITRKMVELYPATEPTPEWYDHLQKHTSFADRAKAAANNEPTYEFKHPILSDQQLGVVTHISKAMQRRAEERHDPLMDDAAKWLGKLVDGVFGGVSVNRPEVERLLRTVGRPSIAILAVTLQYVVARRDGVTAQLSMDFINELFDLHKQELEASPPELKQPFHNTRRDRLDAIFIPNKAPTYDEELTERLAIAEALQTLEQAGPAIQQLARAAKSLLDKHPSKIAP